VGSFFRQLQPSRTEQPVMLHDRLLLPSLVIVSSGPSAEN